MKINNQQLTLSATDLSAHLGCNHLTQLSLRVARGELKRPYYNDPTFDVLRDKGNEHELEYLEHLKAQGLSVVEFSDYTATPDGTLAAMVQGVDVIFQATLDNGHFRGRAGFCGQSAARAEGSLHQDHLYRTRQSVAKWIYRKFSQPISR